MSLHPYQAFTVTLSELSSYQLTVVAACAVDAERIAKTALFEDMSLPVGFKILTRECDATANLASEQPSKQYRVTIDWSTIHENVIPANSHDDAIVSAKRLICHDVGPFDFDMVDSRLGDISAKEVVS